MNFYLVTAFNFSILLPGLVAVFLFSRISGRYYPFIFCLWIGCLNESLSLWLMLHGKHTLVNSNVYVLLEALLLTWFFRKTEVLRNKTSFAMAAVLLLGVWVAENFFFGRITLNSTYFRIFAALVIVWLSIQLIGEIIFTNRSELFNSPEFVLCFCFIIYFCFKALLQSFVIYGVTRDVNFLVKIYNIMLYINLGVNLFYIPAIIWMPRKVPFTSQLS